MIYVILIWLGCFVFTFWALCDLWKREFGKVTLRDIVVSAFVSLTGPLSIPAGIMALCSARENFMGIDWDKVIW